MTIPTAGIRRVNRPAAGRAARLFATGGLVKLTVSRSHMDGYGVPARVLNEAVDRRGAKRPPR